MTKLPDKIEPIIPILVGLLVFFTLVLIYCAHMFPSDGVVFATFSSVLSGCSGALFMRVKSPKSGDDSSVAIGNTTITPEAPAAKPEEK